MTTQPTAHRSQHHRKAERGLRANGYFEYADYYRQLADQIESDGTHQAGSIHLIVRAVSRGYSILDGFHRFAAAFEGNEPTIGAAVATDSED